MALWRGVFAKLRIGPTRRGLCVTSARRALSAPVPDPRIEADLNEHGEVRLAGDDE